MAIAAYFHPKNMTLAQFTEIHRRLEKAGAEPDPHRLHHSCFGDGGDLMVADAVGCVRPQLAEPQHVPAVRSAG